MSQRHLLAFFTRISPPKRKHVEMSRNDNVSDDSESPDKKSETSDLCLYPNLITLKDKLVIDFGRTWYKELAGEFSKPYFKKLAEFVNMERKQHVVFPKPEEVFSWSRLCDFEEVKVVILGQDPYHGEGQAHGLCFSVKIGIPPPPSLLNIYKELETDIVDFKAPSHGHLIGWAKQGKIISWGDRQLKSLWFLFYRTSKSLQYSFLDKKAVPSGVLLLNACLTVRKGQPNSHINKGWENFTDAVIKAINSNLEDVVFLLWGSYAQKKKLLITKGRHHILCAPHPSPLSAARGWFGCRHFSKANDLLVKANKKPIDWSFLPETLEMHASLPEDINPEVLNSIIEDEPLDFFTDPFSEKAYNDVTEISRVCTEILRLVEANSTKKNVNAEAVSGDQSPKRKKRFVCEQEKENHLRPNETDSKKTDFS